MDSSDISLTVREHNPFVSVIINCHNGERYLHEAIDSVYSQTFSDWEIIFWDNASTDRSSVIAKSYDNKLRYHRSDTLYPLYTARNLALDECRGRVVTFLDCDDIWLSEKLALQVDLYKAGNKLVYGPYLLIDSEGSRLPDPRLAIVSGHITDQLLRKSPISIGCVLLDKNLLKFERFDPYYDLLGDFDLWVRLSLKHHFICTKVALEFSRQHGGNTSYRLNYKWHGERRYFYRKFVRLAGFFRYPGIILYIIKAEIKGILGL